MISIYKNDYESESIYTYFNFSYKLNFYFYFLDMLLSKGLNVLYLGKLLWNYIVTVYIRGKCWSISGQLVFGSIQMIACESHSLIYASGSFQTPIIIIIIPMKLSKVYC